MANLEIIDSTLHKDLRVAIAYERELGHGMGSVMVLPSEILEVQREYPIVFRKHPETGQFLTTALLGFEQQENLFLGDGAKWQAKYIPLAMTKGPFFVGVNKESAEKNLVICINRDDPRVGKKDGELLFDETGSPSIYLHSIRVNLFRLHEGITDTKNMVDAFLAANLIESVNLEIEFINKQAINFNGAYTINAENLTQLSDEQIKSLNAEGYLALAYFIAGSLGNVRHLIEMKNKILSL
ncbi:MAG: SapC family protein [Pseudomonadota bacterium]